MGLTNVEAGVFLDVLDRPETFLETFEEPGDVEAIDEGVVYFDRYRHKPAAILLGIPAEYNPGNGVFVAVCRIRYGCKSNPGKCRVINEIIAA